MKKIKAFLASLMMLATLPLVQDSNIASAVDSNALNGTYVIRNVNSGIYMSIDSNNVVQNTLTKATELNTWKLQATRNGYYQILAMNGNALNAETTDANISVSKATGADNQLFSLDANTDGSFRIVNKSSGKAVEVINAETTAGANIQQWELNGVNCQDWELIPVNYATGNLKETNVTVTGEDYIAGDLNDDKIVNIYDWVLAKKILLSGKGTEHQKLAGNVTGDGNFAVKDIIALQKYLHGNGKLIKQDISSERRYAGIDANYTEGVSETTNAGFTESAYLNLDNKENVTATWNVSANADGVYALTVKYANGGTSDRTVAVTVNNQIVYWTLKGESTGAWTTWQEEVIYLPLQEGVNEITFTSQTADGAANIDYICIKESKENASASQPIAPIKAKL